MTTSPNPTFASNLRRYLRLAGIFFIGVGCAVILGWLLNIPIVNVVAACLMIGGTIFVLRHADTSRQEAVTALSEAYAEFELRVQARTAAVEQTNRQLEVEVAGRKETEQALRERDQIFQEITDHLDQAVWLRDASADKMLFMSPAYETITGRSTQSVLENIASLLEGIHPDDAEGVRQARAQHVEGTFETEYRIVRPNGSIRWIRARNFPIRNSDGAVYRIAGISEDVTAHKEGEAHRLELLIERERVDLLKRFLSDASHDFRTPLAIMSVSLYLLDKMEATEKQRHHIGVVKEQYERLQRLIEDLFTLSRLDKTTTAELEIQRCDLNAVVNAACKRQQPLLASKRSQLILELASGLPSILANASEISLAVQHLLVNAINYSPGEAEITVSTQQNNDRTVILTVEDKGIGISASDLPHIFERFYRADPARSINTGGLGLGLTIAKRIVEAHHGTITVQSVPGKGSTFTLTFPAFR